MGLLLFWLLLVLYPTVPIRKHIHLIHALFGSCKNAGTFLSFVMDRNAKIGFANQSDFKAWVNDCINQRTKSENWDQHCTSNSVWVAKLVSELSPYQQPSPAPAHLSPVLWRVWQRLLMPAAPESVTRTLSTYTAHLHCIATVMSTLIEKKIRVLIVSLLRSNCE